MFRIAFMALAAWASMSLPAWAQNTSSSNPSVSLILNGAYGHSKLDPTAHRITGFALPAEALDELRPQRGFNLGESELGISAQIDPQFKGRMTLAVTTEGTVEIEEALVQSTGLANGHRVNFGRYLSAMGYLNAQHAHAWDFADLPLVHQAFFGGQYKQDGLQWRWLAPTDRFLELGVELGKGAAYPGSDGNRNGAGAHTLFVNWGGDWGRSQSWLFGASMLDTQATAMETSRLDADEVDVTNAFTGRTRVWSLSGVWKWSPNGNATQRNLKLQGEYFRRQSDGDLTYDVGSQSQGEQTDRFSQAASGWYVQGVYQFAPGWRVGVRNDQLRLDSTQWGNLAAALQVADHFKPERHSLMLDHSPSEFSRFRLQLSQDRLQPGLSNQVLQLQYTLSLGAHGAHSY